MPSLHLATAHTAGGGRSYLYELAWPAPASGGALGACHALDIPLVFGVLDSGLAAQLIGTPPPLEACGLSAQMQLAWTAFARDGQPGWPVHDDQHHWTRVFDNAAHSGVRAYPSAPHADRGPTPPTHRAAGIGARLRRCGVRVGFGIGEMRLSSTSAMHVSAD
jgi:para-nitrobenzyl esterase